MNLQEEVIIPLDRVSVYAALNDPEILQASIPGCETLTRISDTEMEATVVVKFGPVKASFNSEVTLNTDGQPCLLYTSPSPRDATLSRMPSSA